MQNSASQSQPSLRQIPCDQCRSSTFEPLFKKPSERGEVFSIVKCSNCGLVQVNPQPTPEAVAPYYEASYFEKRTDRGYDNYFSEELKRQIQGVYEMNLRDLDFFSFEQALLEKKAAEGKYIKTYVSQSEDTLVIEERAQLGSSELRPKSLDVGCAAGYFVEYMQSRGWDSEGVELSQKAASFGTEKLGLRILVADFLSTHELSSESYDLLSFWASIEHMHSPRRVLERCFSLLRPGGRLLLSTCRWGVLSAWKGKNWRFMNVPEHLYFFSLYGLLKLSADIGFQEVRHITYGSGFTTRQDAGVAYRLGKALADPLVKILDQGDMMALHLRKPD